MELVSQRIQQIRASALRALGAEPHHTCPTCCRHETQPYRRTVEGKITEGCIDPCHSAPLHGLDQGPDPDSSAVWHYRPTAVQHRQAVLRALLDAGRDSGRIW